MNQKEKRLAEEHSNWLNQFSFWRIYVNLNFEANIHKQKCIDLAVNFCNRQDVLIYKNAVIRKKLRIKRAMYIEGDDVSNYHYHGVWELPNNLPLGIDDINSYCSQLLMDWNGMYGSGSFTRIEPIINEKRVIDYISKKAGISELGMCCITTYLG